MPILEIPQVNCFGNRDRALSHTSLNGSHGGSSYPLGNCNLGNNPSSYSINEIINILSNQPDTKPASITPVVSLVDEILNEAKKAAMDVDNTRRLSDFELAVLAALA